MALNGAFIVKRKKHYSVILSVLCLMLIAAKNPASALKIKLKTRQLGFSPTAIV